MESITQEKKLQFYKIKTNEINNISLITDSKDEYVQLFVNRVVIIFAHRSNVTEDSV